MHKKNVQTIHSNLYLCKYKKITMVKIGDKVRFLNAIGGGTVIKIDGRIATVLEDDGFEIPSMISELVVIESVNQLNFPTEQVKTEIPQKTLNKKNESFDFNKKDENPDKDQLSIYIAFVPKNIKELQTTDCECFIINDSNYYLQFSLFAGDKLPLLLENDEIEPQTKLFLQDVKKEQLNDFRNIVFQAIALKKQKNFSIKPTINIHKELDLTKFYKLHYFSDNVFFHQKALLITLMEKDFSDNDFIVTESIAKKFFDKKVVSQTHTTKKKQNSPIEVDLHINALLDSTAGMSNADILNFQLQKFHDTMNEYRKKTGCKIVFIHGKGEGVLRKEIEKQLKTKYKSCYYQDASFLEYGFGATQVTIK